MEIILFLNGILFFYSKNSLSLIFLFSVCFIKRRVVFFIAFLLGVSWAALHIVFFDPHGMPKEAVMRHALLSGTITSVPDRSPNKTQFQFHVDTLNHQPARANILVSCYQKCPIVQLGQRWVLTAKIHKPRRYGNPGSFDYVRWLTAQHISWLANMELGQPHYQIKTVPNHGYILSLRENLSRRLEQLHFKANSMGIVQALALGLTKNLNQSLWDLFRRTGTTHLMVISGAHIGLVAGFGFFLTKWLWCRLERLCLHIPAQQAAAVVGMIFALGYAILAGFAVPAQRSLIACCVMLSRYFLNWRFSTWQAWRYALFLVLIIEPHAVYLSGFYLSFMAVAILVAINQRIAVNGWRKMIAIQLACLLGLMPLTLFWFSYGAVNGLLANLLAIPWVGFVIVPLSLITTLFGEWQMMSWLNWVLDQAIVVLLYYLNTIDRFAWVNLTYTYASIISPLSMLLAMILMLFLPLRQYRLIIGIFTLVGIYPKHEAIKKGEARVDVLDVGQGLAVLVRTANHTMIYDTGMQFYRGSDMGQMVILPYLKTLGIYHLNKVVISHPDQDHRGGLKSLQAAMSVDELIVDNPKRYRHAVSCHRYPDWSWDDVKFHFFQIKTDLHSKNNTSCVLQLSTAEGQVLLTGDIEKKAEQYLVINYDQQLQSSLIVVPHHGSKTSSSDLFLSMVKPKYAFISYGFDNRYRFPHEQVLARYQARSVELFNTVDCGMISVTLSNKGLLSPGCYRK